MNNDIEEMTIMRYEYPISCWSDKEDLGFETEEEFEDFEKSEIARVAEEIDNTLSDIQCKLYEQAGSISGDISPGELFEFDFMVDCLSRMMLSIAYGNRPNTEETEDFI